MDTLPLGVLIKVLEFCEVERPSPSCSTAVGERDDSFPSKHRIRL